MLLLGLMARDHGQPASRRLGITNDALAFAFDAAVTVRLAEYDNQRREADFEALKLLIVGPDKDGSNF